MIQALHFNLVVPHALGLEAGQHSLAPRTLYYFRDRVAGAPALMATFRIVTETITGRLNLFAAMSNDATRPIFARTGPTSAAWG